ncbi:MAG TPA: DUF4157 domain-containing protein [Chloroflexota bacterium]
MQERQAKTDRPARADAAEGPAARAVRADDATRLPAWSASWGDQPAASLRALPAVPVIQRLADDAPAPLPEAPEPAPAATVAPAPVAATAEVAGPDEAPARPLIVADAVTDLEPGQARKSDFLADLQAAVCASVADALVGTPWSASGCPYVEYWFGYYGQRESHQVERAIRRYVPGVAGASAAAEYIPPVTARVRQAVDRWRTTGEVTGVPEGLTAEAGVAAPAAAPGGTAPAIEATAPAAPPAAATAPGAAEPTIAYKAREGGAATADARQVQARLGPGRGLDGSVQSRMELAFGLDFSAVRVHTDAGAGRLADSLHARAFTVGHDVAFAPGEYRPGTPIGDAIIAHELAHVRQQSGGRDVAPLADDGPQYSSLEEDADATAASALVALWGSATTRAVALAGNVLPSLRSGLRLQRCKSGSDQKADRIAKLQRDIAALDAVISDPAHHSVGEIGRAIGKRKDLEQDLVIEQGGTGKYVGTKAPAPPAGATPTPQPYDCTIYVVEVLAETLKAKGRAEEWKQVLARAKKLSGSGGLKGTNLIKSLQEELGWKAVFWAPDTQNPADGSSEHSFAAHVAQTRGTYYNMPVEKTKSVINYRPTNRNLQPDLTNLDHLKQVPFGVIAARGGLHMAIILNAVVYEVHWKEVCTSQDVITATPLADWEWLSGVIGMPAEDLW